MKRSKADTAEARRRSVAIASEAFRGARASRPLVLQSERAAALGAEAALNHALE
jgi:hypothetical protein